MARPEPCWTGLMTRRSQRRKGDRLVVPPVPGTLRLPAVPAGRPVRRRGALVARTLRTRWWPRIVVTGVLAVVVGATLVSGKAGLWVTFAGAMIIFVITYWALAMSLGKTRREPPTPPGGGAAGP